MEDDRFRDSFSRRHPPGRFADYVRLHGASQKLILIEQERELLKAGITEFGLSLSEASGLLHSAVRESDTLLESQAEQHLHTLLDEPRTPREARLAARGRPVDKMRLTRKQFERAVDFYQTLTRAALSRDEARQRVKAMVLRQKRKACRDWWRLGSRKWFDAIEQEKG